MGRELTCTVRSQGKSARGKALLETTEIIFRGEPRLKIPFASLISAKSSNGELHLQWKDGSAVFELGDQAEKWANKILHPKSLLEKLGIKEGLRISVRSIADAGLIRDLRSNAKQFSNFKPLPDSDLIFFGAAESTELAALADLIPYLANSGAFWIIYPKGKQEIRETDVLTAGRSAGLVDIKVVGFSARHTALKFVRPKSRR